MSERLFDLTEKTAIVTGAVRGFGPCRGVGLAAYGATWR